MCVLLPTKHWTYRCGCLDKYIHLSGIFVHIVGLVLFLFRWFSWQFRFTFWMWFFCWIHCWRSIHMTLNNEFHLCVVDISANFLSLSLLFHFIHAIYIAIVGVSFLFLRSSIEWNAFIKISAVFIFFAVPLLKGPAFLFIHPINTYIVLCNST